MTAAAFFDAARALKRELTGEPLSQDDVDALNAVIATWKARVSLSEDAGARLTPRVAMELISHEAIVSEAYKDSVGVWTWSVGITNASGHDVSRYVDNPQTIERCLEVYIWLLRTNYIPAVEQAFIGHALTEAQFAAALSFHYNTGKILVAEWVKQWKRGDPLARSSFLNWRKPPEIIPRRTKERDLFFDGKWSNDGKATVYPVRKPSYTPDFGAAKRVDVSAILEGLL